MPKAKAGEQKTRRAGNVQPAASPSNVESDAESKTVAISYSFSAEVIGTTEGQRQLAVAMLEEVLRKSALPFMRALEVFGDSERAVAWMWQGNPALGGLPPAEALLANDGPAEVLDVLGRIEHGVLS